MSLLKNLAQKYIFVDEISMVKEIFYKFLLMIKKMNPEIKFIISGDITRQLLPINDRAKFEYEDSIALKELCNYNTLQMSKCRRSDKKVYDVCNFDTIMQLDTEQFSHKQTKKNICYTNKKRIQINDMLMNKYKKNNYVKINKRIGDPNSQTMYVYKNLPIIAKHTDDKIRLYNNEEYIVTNIDKNKIEVKSCIEQDKILIFSQKDFAINFNPAYCLTVHCSQGCTIKEPYTIHEFKKFSKRLRYTALSRASKFEDINIL